MADEKEKRKLEHDKWKAELDLRKAEVKLSQERSDEDIELRKLKEEIGEETRLKLQFLDTRRERTTCARRSFMAGSVARNDGVVQEGDGQTTSETGWDHRSENAQEWHRNEPSHRASAMKMI